MRKITVIGTGNGGQAVAGYFAAMGLPVCLYGRRKPDIPDNIIRLEGALNAVGVVEIITDSIEKAVCFADLIMIVTTSTAHREIANLMLPFLRNGQAIILNPGRTLGIVELNGVLAQRKELNVMIAEAQTLLYACRKVRDGVVKVIGVKDNVPLTGRTPLETETIISRFGDLFPGFIPAVNFIHTGLENIGAIFHPSIVIFNVATIERNDKFYFYRDMTDEVAAFIEKLDKERLRIGRAYGIRLMPVFEWIRYAYPETEGCTLKERFRNNPAYNDILGPGTIFTRQLTEDIPTGLLPMSELARLAGVDTPLMDSLIVLTSSLLDIDFREKGRTLDNLNLSGMSKDEIIKLFQG